MEILVCIKQVPGSNKVEVDPVTGVLKRNGADSKMNPYDLYALECGMKLKEQYGGRVSVITMGPPPAATIIREAFAMGADEGALVSDRAFGGADVLATSYTLAQGIKKMGKFDVIICGLQTTDGDTAQVGPEVSEALDIPCVCNVAKIDKVEDNAIFVDMEMAHEFEQLKATEKREIAVYALKDMEDQDKNHYGLSGSATQVQRIFPPVSDKEQETWTGSGAELADKLHGKLKQLKFIS